MFSLNRIGQLLQHLTRAVFDRAVQQHKAERHCKGFRCWDQLVAMVYGQLSGAGSLRELEVGFNQYGAQHYHLGTRAVRRSTLADANARRTPQVFAQTAQALMGMANRRTRREGNELLYLLDSSSIALRERGHEWARASATRIPGLKLHVLLDAQQARPAHHSITAANVNDLDEARKLCVQPGATYVFDKGYCDYNWWSRIDCAGAYFVTRLKRNAAVRRVSSRTLQEDCPESAIVADEVIEMIHRSCRGGHRNDYRSPLRRVMVRREGEQPLVLVTNNLQASAQQVARWYKDRWQIELLFKWIKQHLRIKRFWGQSENAIRIQLITALIAYLLVLMQNASGAAKRALWYELAELRAGLFFRPDPERAQAQRLRARERLLQQQQSDLFAT
jgi:putative transposase